MLISRYAGGVCKCGQRAEHEIQYLVTDNKTNVCGKCLPEESARIKDLEKKEAVIISLLADSAAQSLDNTLEGLFSLICEPGFDRP